MTSPSQDPSAAAPSTSGPVGPAPGTPAPGSSAPGAPGGEQNPGEVRPEQGLHVRIDEQHMQTTYANAFRTHTTAEEVMVDFGVNLLTPRPDGGKGHVENQLSFQINDRVIINYYTVKRLAITLSQIVRQHEQQFGPLELNVSDRVVKK